jgi:hypothetical protein
MMVGLLAQNPMTICATPRTQEGVKVPGTYLVLGCSHEESMTRAVEEGVKKELLAYFRKSTKFIDGDLPLVLCTPHKELSKALAGLTKFVDGVVTVGKGPRGVRVCMWSICFLVCVSWSRIFLSHLSH